MGESVTIILFSTARTAASAFVARIGLFVTVYDILLLLFLRSRSDQLSRA
jgi:hypothetical protein